MQYITDEQGNRTGVQLTIEEWVPILHKITTEPIRKAEEVSDPERVARFRALAGSIAPERAELMLKEVEEGRQYWEERVNRAHAFRH